MIKFHLFWSLLALSQLNFATTFSVTTTPTLSPTKECKPPLWGLPDPFQIELHPTTSLAYSSPLNVAIITAGSIRSFALAKRSWEKYLLSNSKISHHSLYLFAHIIALPNCPLSVEGLTAIKSLCHDLEISYSPSLLTPLEHLLKEFPDHYQNNQEFLDQFLQLKRGNFIDMYHRRYRAYQLAQRYSQEHSIQWDLIMFLRPDIAFYSPILNISMFYHTLKTWKENQPIESIPRPIYVPESCNFHGVCDRLAIGLPEEMKIYFHKHFFLNVMKWSLDSVPRSSSLYCPKKNCLSFSEDLLECWFLMNNITQIFYSRPIPLTFITLRSLYAMEYCSSSRKQYVTELPTPYFANSDADKYTARIDTSRDYDHEDEISSIEIRCGKQFLNINLSLWCDENIMNCACGDRNRWGIS